MAPPATPRRRPHVDGADGGPGVAATPIRRVRRRVGRPRHGLGLIGVDDNVAAETQTAQRNALVIETMAGSYEVSTPCQRCINANTRCWYWAGFPSGKCSECVRAKKSCTFCKLSSFIHSSTSSN